MTGPETMLPPFSPENTELLLTLAQSRFGLQLAQQIRYERYAAIPDAVSHYDLPPDQQAEFTKRWCEEEFDADVNNLQHHPFTALIGQWAAETDGLDAATTNQIARALLVHDVPEARFSRDDEGDLTYDETAARGMVGFKEDHQTLATILRGEEFPQISDQEAAAIEAAMNDGKSGNPQTLVGQYIEIGERLGYIHNGLVAGQRAHQIMLENPGEYEYPKEYARKLWMAENCLANSLTRLIELAPNHPSVHQFLALNHAALGQVLSQVILDDDVVWAKYREDGQTPEQVSDRTHKFHTAMSAWNEKGRHLAAA